MPAVRPHKPFEAAVNRKSFEIEVANVATNAVELLELLQSICFGVQLRKT
jgi:hypothetical protein